MNIGNFNKVFLHLLTNSRKMSCRSLKKPSNGKSQSCVRNAVM